MLFVTVLMVIGLTSSTTSELALGYIGFQCNETITALFSLHKGKPLLVKTADLDDTQFRPIANYPSENNTESCIDSGLARLFKPKPNEETQALITQTPQYLIVLCREIDFSCKACRIAAVGEKGKPKPCTTENSTFMAMVAASRRFNTMLQTSQRMQSAKRNPALGTRKPKIECNQLGVIAICGVILLQIVVIALLIAMFRRQASTTATQSSVRNAPQAEDRPRANCASDSADKYNYSVPATYAVPTPQMD